ncbi:MAG: hypothetical protein NT135_03500 [Candidatus Berkelbacteria bacterium]|nr:hypothetical protein [Candidatus Berkelbacteria bacterium]
MGRYLTITNSDVTKLGYKKRMASSSFSVGPISFKFIMTAIICILGLFFISQSNEASLRGYKIRDLEDKKDRLVLENQKLDAEVARLKSLGSLQDKDLNLVQPQKIDYLPAQNPVAVTK